MPSNGPEISIIVCCYIDASLRIVYVTEIFLVGPNAVLNDTSSTPNMSEGARKAILKPTKKMPFAKCHFSQDFHSKLHEILFPCLSLSISAFLKLWLLAVSTRVFSLFKESHESLFKIR